MLNTMLMNLNIFKTNDPTGKFSREKYVVNYYPDEYDYIINYCNNNNIDINLPFKEKLYLAINDINSIPKCKNENCTNNVKYKNSTIGYHEYCSNKCVSSDPIIKNIKKEKSLKKFGTNTPAESNIIKNKIIETNIKKYGGNSPMSNINILEKSKSTLLANYNVDNPSKSKDILSKRIEAFKQSNFIENYQKTSMHKYGVMHPWKSKDIHNKTIDKFYSSYKNRIEENLPIGYKFIKFEYKPTLLIIHCDNCDINFSINSYQFYYRKVHTPNQICTNCYPISENSSLVQTDLTNFIINNYDGVIEKNKKMSDNTEIDIFIPELNLGIEFNGLYWHSELFKNNDYHHKKWLTSIKDNLKLITIWEDDWIIKNEICKSFLLNKLNKIKNKIFARKCKIQIINTNNTKKFLEENHLQGNCSSSIKIGLYNDEKLISLMTFSKLRLPLSGKNENENVYELTRFVTKLDTICIGGASKLLKYFIQNYKPDEIISYSDNLISDGELYQKLNFKLESVSNPGYWYVINKQRVHRFNWRKSKLVEMGYDKNKTEFEIMNELGYYKIFNAGNKKWRLKF